MKWLLCGVLLVTGCTKQPASTEKPRQDQAETEKELGTGRLPLDYSTPTPLVIDWNHRHISQQYSANAQQWVKSIQGHAIPLFWILGTISAVWSFV